MSESLEIDKVIGLNIRERRTACGMTQAQLGAKMPLGLSSQQISEYELGNHSLSCHRLADIADILGCSLVDLFDGVAVSLEQSTSNRATVAAMGHYQELPGPVQDRLRDLMRALAQEAGARMHVNNLICVPAPKERS